jgi:hypothetical protein
MNAFYQRLVSVILAVSCLAAPVNACDPAFSPVKITRKVLSVDSSLSDTSDLSVFSLNSSTPIFGAVSKERGMLHFVPSVPFVLGATYRVEIQAPNGSVSKYLVTLDQESVHPPLVFLSPASNVIPANTLKLYLDFTQPMEQGVFLEYITLQRQNGAEVTGAFRETELWSPDGKRLTLMFHPGRQKTGVNLNTDEGPVLIAGERYKLVINGQWRSTAGAKLGRETFFTLLPTAADHAQPDPEKWQIDVTKDSVSITTDELFEPQVFQRAVQLQQVTGTASTQLLPPNHLRWTFKPDKPWPPGNHQISIDPALEDLAGNSIAKPFEIDLEGPKPSPKRNRLTFRPFP